MSVLCRFTLAPGGEEVWISPDHVRAVLPHESGPDRTSVYIGGGKGERVVVGQTIDKVVAAFQSKLSGEG